MRFVGETKFHLAHVAFLDIDSFNVGMVTTKMYPDVVNFGRYVTGDRHGKTCSV